MKHPWDTNEKAREVIEAAEALLEDNEMVRTPAEARLALALHDYDPETVSGKENCTCDSRDECDECLTRPEYVELLKRMVDEGRRATEAESKDVL